MPIRRLELPYRVVGYKNTRNFHTYRNVPGQRKYGIHGSHEKIDLASQK